MAGRQDVLRDSFNAGCGHAGVSQRLSRPLGASRLVVMGHDIVDGVMEPERHFHLVRLDRQTAMLRQQQQALRQVLERMVLALRLLIGGDEALHERNAVTLGFEARPAAVPG